EVVQEDVTHGWLDGRLAHAAVANDHGGHPVPGGTGEQRIPGDLGVVVRVRIDKSRCEDEPVGINGLPGSQPRVTAEVRDMTVRDAQRHHKTGVAGAITETSVLDDQIEHGALPYLACTLQCATVLLFPAVAHQGPGALGTRGHGLLRVSDDIHTRHLALPGGLVRTRQCGSDVVRVHHVFGMTAKSLKDFVVPYIRGV